MVYVLHLGNTLLPKHLECTHPLVPLVVGLVHLPEVAEANDTFELEIGDLWLQELFFWFLGAGTASSAVDFDALGTLSAHLKVCNTRLLPAVTLFFVVKLFEKLVGSPISGIHLLQLLLLLTNYRLNFLGPRIPVSAATTLLLLLRLLCKRCPAPRLAASPWTFFVAVTRFHRGYLTQRVICAFDCTDAMTARSLCRVVRLHVSLARPQPR